MPDINFDTRVERFQRRIYGGRKGQLRLELAWRAMRPALSVQEVRQNTADEYTGDELCCWDAGGGLGQISARLAECGHRVILSDLSAEMLAAAEPVVAKHPSIESVHGSIQALAPRYAERFDLVVCHAVLEWLEQPLAVLPMLHGTLKPGGWLSLMFYNRHSLALLKLRRGDLARANAEHRMDGQWGFTPPNPQDPQTVLDAVVGQGFEVVDARGIRVVYELMPEDQRDGVDLNVLLAQEEHFGGEAPFKFLGRYFHLLCRKP